MSETNNYPIIFVHGVLGWGDHEVGFGNYWGRAHEVKKQGYTIEFASVGPISSYWDRARELFYQIKGGDDCVYKCDEYEKHHIHNEPLDTDNQKLKKISNWKKGLTPKYSDWDAKHPIHLVGHSQGAWTILLLQYMLAQGDLFPGHETDASWIRSVTTISGVLNGTTAPYAVCDFDEKTGFYKGSLSPWGIRRFLAFNFLVGSPTEFLYTAWHAYNDRNSNWPTFIKDLQKVFETGRYNWDLDQWNITRNKNMISSKKLEMLLSLFFVCGINFKDFLYGQDNAAYCLSVIGTRYLNELFKVYDRTTYFSYVTQQKHSRFHFFLKRFGNGIANYPIKKLIKTKHWPDKTSRWPVEAEDDDLWQINDGLVPVISQKYPWLGVKEKNYFPVVESEDKGVFVWPKKTEPGTWYTMNQALKGWDHTDIVMFPQKKVKIQWAEQYWFYLTLCSNLDKLPVLPIENE
ncbi:hypothetical protein L4D76_27715 [Photobacterium sagamiensis]|uniref:esterase/lipase family protein n=1 Tax=Photobacterium sagamiensis TaxID=2910241 RepID=UPI003D12C648